MKHRRNWVIGIILAATAGFVALQSVTAPEADISTSTPSITNTSTPFFTDTPTLAHANEGCGYTWAYHDDPALTEKFDKAVRDINPDASARAELFGEDCVYADGSSVFSAMETDFYVQLPVDDLTNEEAFGNWIAQVMSFTTQIPEDEIQGNDGFVEFSFIKSETERIIFRVPIATYLADAKDKSGTELYRFFHAQ